MPRAADDRSRDGIHRQQLIVGAFRVDAGALQVESNGVPTRLKPKAMGVLLALAREPGVTRSRDELLDEVWGSVHVTPGVVGHAVTALRRAFGDDLENPTYIETIPRIGYRLVAPVTVLADAGAAVASPVPDDAQRTAADAPAPAGALTDPATVPAADAGSAPRTRRHRWLQPIAAVAILLAVVAVVLAAGPWQRQSDATAGAPANAPGGLHAEAVRRITFAPGSEDHPRLNPGGDWLVYTRRDGLGDRPALFLQSLHGTGVIPLADGEHAERPAWSPDGREVAYVWRSVDRSRCEIRATTIDGTGHQTITHCPPNSVVFLDWNPVDADQIAWSAIVPGSAAASRVRLLRRQEGWAPEPFDYDVADTAVDLYPRFSPDGRRIAFRGSTNPTSDLYSVATSGGKIRRLTTLRSEINGFDWLPDGSGLVFSSNHEGHRALYAVDLADGTVSALGIADASSPDVTQHGWTVAFQLENWRSALAEYPLDGGPRRLLAPSSGRDYSAALSTHGRRIVFASDRDGSSQLWSLEGDSAEAIRLTRHEAGRLAAPVLSADGNRVLYVLRVHGRHELHEFDFDQGQSRLVTVASHSLRNAIYAGDDRSIWYAGWHQDGWYLHACARADDAADCSGRPTQRTAFRVERAAIGGRAALLLADPRNQGKLMVYAEEDLQPLDPDRAPLAVREPWRVVDDALWSLQRLDNEDGEVALDATSLDDGRVTRLATLSGIRLLLGEGFQVASDRRRLVLPVATENRTDIGVARLVPGSD